MFIDLFTAQDTAVLDLFSGMQSVSKGFGANLMGVKLLIEMIYACIVLLMSLLLQQCMD